MMQMNWKNIGRLPIASYGPIGVDIGAHTVNAVQVRRRGSDLAVVASASLPRVAKESTRDIAARLVNVLHRQNFRGREVVLAAPAKQLEADLLELPPRSSGAPLEKLTRSELGRSAAMTSAPFEMATWDLPVFSRSAAGTSLMAVAMRHVDAEQLVDDFALERLEVRAIDAAACACSRACLTATDTPDMTAIVDLGWNGFRLVLSGRAVVVYQRVLSETGIGALHHEIETRLAVPADVAQFVIASVGADPQPGAAESPGIDPGEVIRIRATIARHVEGIAAELKASFAFATHRFPELPLKHLIIAGGGAIIPGIAQAIGNRLQIVPSIWNAQHLGGQLNPALMTATGLALYEGD